MISDRELEVLELLVKEKNTREIAEELCLSVETIKTHRKNLLCKMGVTNSIGLVRKAYELGLLMLIPVSDSTYTTITKNDTILVHEKM